MWRWLFTYFFGASPIAGNLPSNLPRDLRFPVRSLRSSSYGYANQKGEEITYDSFEEQLAQLKERIDQRHLHLQLKEHEEIFPIHVTFDYQIGPREYLLSLFPEVLKINNDQQ